MNLRTVTKGTLVDVWNENLLRKRSCPSSPDFLRAVWPPEHYTISTLATDSGFMDNCPRLLLGHEWSIRIKTFAHKIYVSTCT